MELFSIIFNAVLYILGLFVFANAVNMKKTERYEDAQTEFLVCGGILLTAILVTIYLIRL